MSEFNKDPYKSCKTSDKDSNNDEENPLDRTDVDLKAYTEFKKENSQTTNLEGVIPKRTEEHGNSLPP